VPPVLGPELRVLLETPDALVAEATEKLGNPSWEEAERRILLVRLSPFADLERSTSHLVLFAECRSALPGAFLDFAFFPGRADRELLSARGLPWFYGLASGRPPSDFDLVMVSLSFSLELVNLPYLFSTAGIPLRASDRGAAREGPGGRIPIFVLGGSGAAAAGALAGPGGASLVEGLFFGEGEAGGPGRGAIGELASILTEPGAPAPERLLRAASIEGFWLPGGGGPRRRVARPLPSPLLAYPPLNSPEAATARLQITAGCPGLCSFCLEGWDRRPYRERPVAELLAAARELRRSSGAETLEVYSFNFNTHARVFELLFELNRIFLRVSFMSQRVDGISGTRLLARAEAAAGKRSFTLGIEGISRRLRAYYRKGLGDRDIEGALEALVTPGTRELKLFYIVSGLEDEADLAEFASFAASLGKRRDEAAPGLRLLASAGYLVRLPSTPLQFAPLAMEEEPLSRIASSMGSACEAAGVEFRLAAHFDEYCADQLLSLGDPDLLPWLESVPAGAHRYDGSLSRGAWPSLGSFARARGILGPCFLGEKPPSWRPPIDFGDGEALRSHYEEARRFEDRPPCLGAGCSSCGACEDAGDRAAIGGHETEPAGGPAYIERLTRLMAAKAAFASLLVEVEIPPALAGACAEYRSSWLLRRLSSASRGAESAVFQAREALFSAAPLKALLPPSFTGKCVYALSGPSLERIREAALAAALRPIEALPEPGRLRIALELPPPLGEGALGALRGYLAAERVSCIESRAEDGRLRLRPSAKDLRKRLLFEALVSAGPRFSASLELGPRASVPDWLGRLGPRARMAARIAVLGYGVSGT